MKLLSVTPGWSSSARSCSLLRNPVWVVVGIIQPLFYLLLFAPLLKPALARSAR